MLNLQNGTSNEEFAVAAVQSLLSFFSLKIEQFLYLRANDSCGWDINIFWLPVLTSWVWYLRNAQRSFPLDPTKTSTWIQQWTD